MIRDNWQSRGARGETCNLRTNLWMPWGQRASCRPTNAAVESGWRLVSQRLMRALLVVERNVPTDPGARFQRGVVRVQIDLLVLQRAPESLDEHVVDATPFAIHADRDAAVAQRLSERFRG